MGIKEGCEQGYYCAEEGEKCETPCFEPFPSTCGPDEEKCDMGYIDGRCWSGDYCVPKGYSLALWHLRSFPDIPILLTHLLLKVPAIKIKPAWWLTSSAKTGRSSATWATTNTDATWVSPACQMLTARPTALPLRYRYFDVNMIFCNFSSPITYPSIYWALASVSYF